MEKITRIGLTGEFESYGGSRFSAMKTEYVVVAEPLGPPYSFPILHAAYKLSTCFDHHSIHSRI